MWYDVLNLVHIISDFTLFKEPEGQALDTVLNAGPLKNAVDKGTKMIYIIS